MTLLLAFAFGYLLGSIPFGVLLTRATGGPDLRTIGSGNIGATNVLRTGRKGLAAATLLCDMLKGTIAVIAAMRYGPDAALAAGLGAFVGHLFPVWLKFKGGKGVATALGVFIMLFPWAVLVSLGVFILTVLITRYVSLGSVLAAIAFPIAAYLLGAKDWLALLPVCAVSLIIVVKHRENIRRLLSGTESRFTVGKPASAGEKT